MDEEKHDDLAYLRNLFTHHLNQLCHDVQLVFVEGLDTYTFADKLAPDYFGLQIDQLNWKQPLKVLDLLFRLSHKLGTGQTDLPEFWVAFLVHIKKALEWRHASCICDYILRVHFEEKGKDYLNVFLDFILLELAENLLDYLDQIFQFFIIWQLFND